MWGQTVRLLSGIIILLSACTSGVDEPLIAGCTELAAADLELSSDARPVEGQRVVVEAADQTTVSSDATLDGRILTITTCGQHGYPPFVGLAERREFSVGLVEIRVPEDVAIFHHRIWLPWDVEDVDQVRMRIEASGVDADDTVDVIVRAGGAEPIESCSPAGEQEGLRLSHCGSYTLLSGGTRSDPAALEAGSAQVAALVGNADWQHHAAMLLPDVDDGDASWQVLTDAPRDTEWRVDVDHASGAREVFVVAPLEAADGLAGGRG
jgi:hypothetical protein